MVPALGAWEVTDLNWIMSSGFLGMRFYDLPNFFACVLFVIVGSRLLRVPVSVQLVLLGHCILPFFLNGILFPFSYMPDVFKYWREFNAIRAGELGFLQAISGNNVEQASALFSVLPLPFAVTPLSLGFHNTFLLVALFFWLYGKKVFTPASMWFFLLYPSLALYTALGLRDTFILVFMVMAVQWAREGRWVAICIPLWLLLLIKFQNFFIVAPVLILYLVFGVRRSGISVGKGLIALGVGVAALIGISPFALPIVNHFRVAMFVEDGGEAAQVQLIGGPGEFVFEGLTSGLHFLLKPFPWEASNALQLVQSAENLVVGMILVILIRAAWRRVPRKLIFWLLFMTFALSIYGLVVFNYGTAARYRYPFVVLFVIFVCADCHVRSLFKPFAPVHWRRTREHVPSVAAGGKKHRASA
jgi:hypothetical protein